jgi:hypothetical protein
MTRIDQIEHFLLTTFGPDILPKTINALVENAFRTAFKHFYSDKDILKPIEHFMEQQFQIDFSEFPCNGKFYYLTMYEHYLMAMYFKSLAEKAHKYHRIFPYLSFFKKLESQFI